MEIICSLLLNEHKHNFTTYCLTCFGYVTVSKAESNSWAPNQSDHRKNDRVSGATFASMDRKFQEQNQILSETAIYKKLALYENRAADEALRE